MKELKLQKVKSYSGAVHVTDKNPVVTVDDATAAKLLATGYFVECGAAPKAPKVKEVEVAEAEPAIEEVDYEALSMMTRAELTAIAEQNNIDIAKCRTKGDILEAISVACGGNYTMIELQRR